MLDIYIAAAIHMEEWKENPEFVHMDRMRKQETISEIIHRTQSIEIENMELPP